VDAVLPSKEGSMRRLVVLITLAVVAGAAPASAGSQTVSIANFSFTPSSLVVQKGGTVTFDNTSPSTHTATSDDGFFNTGNISGGTSRNETFASAGSFPYHCQIHPIMMGSIMVPVTLSKSGSVPKGTKVAVRFASQDVSGRTYAIQRKIGTGAWVTIASGLTGTSKKFVLKKKGKYLFRADVTLAGAVSGWSPSAKIRVVAA
jgi:plastocyanin